MTWSIPLFKSWSDEQDVESVSEVIRRATYWAVGPEIDSFEKSIADYTKTNYALSYNSGTSALTSAFLAIDIKDKEVIVPSFTFVSNVSPVVLAGGIPVFADSEKDTFGLSYEDVKNKITDKTCAIVAFHYGGIPSKDIEKIRDLAKEKNILLVEDAAESIGSLVNGKMVGSFGDIGMFSLCQNKVISSGEGGLLVTSSKELYEKCKLLRSHGRLEHAEDYFSTNEDNDYVCFGHNYRMSSISATLGNSQLKKIDMLIEKRREIAQKYDEGFSEITEITVPKRLDGHFQVFQMYSIRLLDQKIRDGLQNYLTEKGIMSKVYFNPVHLKTAFVKNYPAPECGLPVVMELSQTVLNIPLYPSMTSDEVKTVIETVCNYFKNGGEK